VSGINRRPDAAERSAARLGTDAMVEHIEERQLHGYEAVITLLCHGAEFECNTLLHIGAGFSSIFSSLNLLCVSQTL